MSVEQGEIVSAIVVGFEPEARGVFVEVGQQTGRVPIYEFAWEHTERALPEERFSIGDLIEIKIQRTFDDSFVGSVRAVHPERDPLEDDSVFSEENTLTAEVVDATDAVVTFQLPRGMEGLLFKKEDTPDLQVGECHDIRIQSLDRAKRRIVVGLANRN